MGIDLSNPTYNHLDDESDTIGSRLRKRRRTGSLLTNGATPVSKRPVPKKVTSPNSRRAKTAITVTEATKEYDSTPTPEFQPHVKADSPHGESTQILDTSSAGISNASGTAVNGAVQASSDANEGVSSPDTVSQSHEPLPISSVAPDLAAVIASIIEHGEAVERRYGEMGQVDTESFGFLGASHHLKTQSLPILDNLVCAWMFNLVKVGTHCFRLHKY